MIKFLPNYLLTNLISQPTATLTSSSSTAPASFGLRARYIGTDFLNAFDWFTDSDPTHGRVNYVDRDTALRSNLTFGTFQRVSLILSVLSEDLDYGYI